MAQKFYNESDIQAIASAIRAKNGLSSTYTVSQMASAIQDIPSGSGGGGNTDMEDGLITRTLSTYENSRVTRIDSYVFQSYIALTSVSFPQVTRIGSYAFCSCSALTSVSFPQVSYIDSCAFRYCKALTSVNFSKVIMIESQAFQFCNALTSVNFPQVTIIGHNAFNRCEALTSVYLGKEQSRLGMLYFSCFSKCYNLIDLTLKGTYLYSLQNSNAFTSTPIAGYSASAGQYGSIYVPAGLYSQYISATNWAYFSNRIVSYEEPVLPQG